MTHRIRPREDWLDPRLPWDHVVNGKGDFYVCPPFRGWPQIDDIVIHYPGADWSSPDWADINGDGQIDETDTIALLRAGHRMYLMSASRGYSYGYGYKIGVQGDIWEVRGDRNANAANLGDKYHDHVGWNNRSISIQLVVNRADPANARQVDAVNWLIDDILRRAGRDLNLKYHGQGQYTACCGAGIIGQLAAGTIGKGLSTPPPPTPRPGGLELEAMYQIALQMQQGTLICRVTADAVIHETNGIAAEVDIAAGVRQVPVSRGQFLGLLAGGRRTVGDPFAVWPDAELAAAWKARRG